MDTTLALASAAKSLGEDFVFLFFGISFFSRWQSFLLCLISFPCKIRAGRFYREDGFFLKRFYVFLVDTLFF